jgi:hypothetical protein
MAALERMLQQPTATPGLAAVTALRQCQAAETPSGAAGAADSGIPRYRSTIPSPELAAPASFEGAGRSRASTAGTAAVAAGSTPALAAPTNRWRLAAERAASFKSPPADSVGISGGGSGWGGNSGGKRSWAPHEPPKLSPAAELLAEIAKVVSPTVSPAGGSRLLAASPSFSYAAAAVPVAESPPGSPLTYPAAVAASAAARWQQQTPTASPQAESASASRWNAVASGGHAGAAATSGGASPGTASPVAAFGFAAHSPALPAGGVGGGVGYASPAVASQQIAMEAVSLPSVQFDLLPQPDASM